MRIFVVMQIAGEYSDAEYTGIAAYTTREAAEARVREDSRELRELRGSAESGRVHGWRYPPRRGDPEIYGDPYRIPDSITLYIEELELLE